MKTLIHEREPFGGCSRANGEREDHNAGFRSGVAGHRMLRMATRLG
jgi:hypothetical protein